MALAPGAIEQLLTVDRAEWRREFQGINDYLKEFGDRVPLALYAELEEALHRVGA
jgi:GTP-dependent phosphoenolpyruvate carboxykinase